MQSNVVLNRIELFSHNNISVFIEVVIQDNNIWMTKEQICCMFNVDARVISKHINNLFIEREFDRQSHVKNWFIKKKYTRTQFFSLDVVVCIAGKLRSSVAQLFRQWSNAILKQRILHQINDNIIAYSVGVPLNKR